MKTQTSNAICLWYRTVSEELSTSGMILSSSDWEESGVCKEHMERW